jgi:hypothetical protein
VRELWWMGLPTNVRGKVWQMAIGNDLNITHGELACFLLFFLGLFLCFNFVNKKNKNLS